MIIHSANVIAGDCCGGVAATELVDTVRGTLFSTGGAEEGEEEDGVATGATEAEGVLCCDRGGKAGAEREGDSAAAATGGEVGGRGDGPLGGDAVNCTEEGGSGERIDGATGATEPDDDLLVSRCVCGGKGEGKEVERACGCCEGAITDDPDLDRVRVSVAPFELADLDELLPSPIRSPSAEKMS